MFLNVFYKLYFNWILLRLLLTVTFHRNAVDASNYNPPQLLLASSANSVAAMVVRRCVVARLSWVQSVQPTGWSPTVVSVADMRPTGDVSSPQTWWRPISDAIENVEYDDVIVDVIVDVIILCAVKCSRPHHTALHMGLQSLHFAIGPLGPSCQ